MRTSYLCRECKRECEQPVCAFCVAEARWELEVFLDNLPWPLNRLVRRAAKAKPPVVRVRA